MPSSAQARDRSLRLAQEVTSLSTSLPLSPSSSVFVRCDEERLDVMKVRICSAIGWLVQSTFVVTHCNLALAAGKALNE